MIYIYVNVKLWIHKHSSQNKRNQFSWCVSLWFILCILCSTISSKFRISLLQLHVIMQSNILQLLTTIPATNIKVKCTRRPVQNSCFFRWVNFSHENFQMAFDRYWWQIKYAIKTFNRKSTWNDDGGREHEKSTSEWISFGILISAAKWIFVNTVNLWYYVYCGIGRARPSRKRTFT